MPTPGTQPGTLDVADFIDSSRIGVFQIGLFVLCALCLIMDGFDVFAMGYVLPSIAKEWNVPTSALGNVLGAGNFGVLLGALLFTIAGDKIGRRPVLIGATLFFSVLTILTARASSVDNLLVLRVIAGIGLGSIMPNATALIGEYSPRRSRVTLMMGITVGFTAGGAVAGFIAGWLIPAFGWRSVFYVGGAIPLVVGALMFFWLPESLQFLVLRGGSPAHVVKWLKRIDPAAPAGGDTRYVVKEEHRGGVPVAHLFREGRTTVTILLWVINFMNLLNLYALSGWLATVASRVGYSASTSVYVAAFLNVGGTIGAYGIAWLIGRRGFIPVLAVSFALACVSIASIGQLLGQPGLSLTPLAIVVFIAGWCVVGGQPGLNALAATFYPTSLRSTGVGWGLGIGRVGAIVGPVMGGQLLGRQWSPQELFLVAAVPALVSAIAMFSLRWVMSAPTTAGAPAVAPR